MIDSRSVVVWGWKRWSGDERENGIIKLHEEIQGGDYMCGGFQMHAYVKFTKFCTFNLCNSLHISYISRKFFKKSKTIKNVPHLQLRRASGENLQFWKQIRCPFDLFSMVFPFQCKIPGHSKDGLRGEEGKIKPESVTEQVLSQSVFVLLSLWSRLLC